MIHTIRIPYRRASSRLGSWLLWITGRLRTFLDFSLGSEFCLCCKAFPFVQGHAVGIIENVARGGPASFLFRHSGSKIAPQTHIRLPPSAPSLRCSFRPPLLISLPAKSESHPASSETCFERTSAPQSAVDRHILTGNHRHKPPRSLRSSLSGEPCLRDCVAETSRGERYSGVNCELAAHCRRHNR